MPQNKKQHYVPKLYFRFFSKDDKNINLYNLKSRKLFVNVPFSPQCYEDYFYSKNPEIEKSNSQLEAKFKEIIDKVIKNRNLSDLTHQDYGYLLEFLLYQWGRTSQARFDSKQQTKLIVDKVMKKMMLEDASLAKKGLTKEDIENVKITWPVDHEVRMLYCLAGIPLLSDLIPAILINNTKTDFLFSDNPVILHNTYFRDKEGIGATGFQSHGLQVFCPLNSKVSIMLYDKNCYQVPVQEGYVLQIGNEQDVDAINKLQLYNCYQNIYFSDENQSGYVRILHTSVGDPKKGEHKVEFLPFHKGDGKTSKVAHFYTTGIEYKLKLSFVKITVNAKLIGRCRNAEIVQEFEKFMDDVFKKAEEKKLSPVIA